jgi:hypothetical protein
MLWEQRPSGPPRVGTATFTASPGGAPESRQRRLTRSRSGAARQPPAPLAAVLGNRSVARRHHRGVKVRFRAGLWISVGSARHEREGARCDVALIGVHHKMRC